MKFAIVGHGRMGREIVQQAVARGHRQVATLGADEMKAPSLDLQGAEVAFEFTHPGAAQHNVARLVASGVGVVCGTTGWTPDDALRSAAIAAKTGTVIAANFSIGMNLFYRVVEHAGELFASTEQFDASLSEAHHAGKRDAPSGTARELARRLIACDPRLDSISEATGGGAATPGELPLVCVRAGSEPGRHTIVWDGPHERIALEHAARSRAGFALGAVLAAETVAGAPGLHTIDDVIDRLPARRPQGRPGGES